MFSSNRWEGLRPSQGWCWLIHLSTLTKSVCLEIKFRLKGPEYGFGIGAICTCSLNKKTPAVVSPHPLVSFVNDFLRLNPYTPSQHGHETFSHAKRNTWVRFYKQTTWVWHRDVDEAAREPRDTGLSESAMDIEDLASFSGAMLGPRAM